MNEWLKKILEKIKTLWTKWSTVQKIILIGIAVGAIVGIVLLFSVSSAPTTVPLLNTAINDQATMDNILFRLEEENVSYTVSSDNRIMVADNATARRMRSILVREDLMPSNTSPWEVFSVDQWKTSDFKNNIDLQHSITEAVIQHIESLDEVDDAKVVITFPKEVLFADQQEPVKASIVIRPTPGSDITNNRKKIEGIQKLVIYAVDGLTVDNITISDTSGKLLNDFEGMERLDEIAITEKQQKLIATQESAYRQKILPALQETFGKDRVRDLNIKIEMDMSKKQITTQEYFPVTVKEDDPTTPYDDSKTELSLTRSSQTATTRWQGTGYNPEGPSGVEGQTSPVYKDSSNLYGMTEQSIVTKNEEINKRDIVEVVSPTMGRRTVSVNIDGKYRFKTDDNGNYVLSKDGKRREREYIPVSAEDLADARTLIQNAIGYDVKRGDDVSVHNIQIYRDPEFELADAAWIKGVQTQNAILYALIGLTAVLIIFIVIKLVMREVERRRRLKEEERLRNQQLEREKRLWDAEQAGMEVSMSVEERKRLELQENAINMAKEHPEDVALLIRTWLMEE